MPHKSPMEKFQRDHSKLPDSPIQVVRETCVLRGWLNVEQTDSLLTLLEQDDCTLQAVILAAGILALSRTLQFQSEQDKPSVPNSDQAKSSYLHLAETSYTSIRYCCLLVDYSLIKWARTIRIGQIKEI